jgi:hypothetical protein
MREGEFSNSVSTISTIDGSFSSSLAPGNHQDKSELHKTIPEQKSKLITRYLLREVDETVLYG